MIDATRLLFGGFAGLAIVSATACVTRRNAVASALWLVVTLFSLAALFVLLDAQFLAVLQVLVYAGAIMVLFIFVVMILNREEVSPVSWRPTRLVGVAGGVYLLVKFCQVSDLGLPAPVAVPETFGTVGSIGDMLFRDFLYPFEAISLLLLVAIVGGVTLSRSHRKEVDAELAAAARKEVHDRQLHDYPASIDEADALPSSGGGHH